MNAPGRVHQYLQELSKEELVALVERLAARDPAVSQALVEQVENTREEDAVLLRNARATIDDVSADSIYAGDEPDASELARLGNRLDALVERGRADDVLLLCQRLVQRANRSVEAMDEVDDGFFAAIAGVLEVMPEALVRSSKTPVEQMLWLTELELSQDYDLLPDMDAFWSREWPTETWSDLADWIAARLTPPRDNASAGDGPPSTDYHRDLWTHRLMNALEAAGRNAEVLPLLEREAELTASYPRLVTYLLSEGNVARAEHWARRGIEAISQRWPGIAASLRGSLQSIREREGDRAGVSALLAYEFLLRPELKAFQDLLASIDGDAERETVRRHALRFLETLVLPWKVDPADSGSAAALRVLADGTSALASWPLPPTGLPDPVPDRYTQAPLVRVLLQIALAEHRVDDILFWYDRAQSQPPYGLHGAGFGASVARAVEESHPDRAITIWEGLAAAAVARTNTESYREAASSLEQSARIEERRGNLAAWRTRVLELQARERRKWRLRQILDDLLRRLTPA